ncbi:MAG: right-handed parallel beta-helix repeat-containing protein, partial [Planctomycetota bacterium]
AGPNRGPAYGFTGCTFTGCGTGIDLQRPAGDTPLLVSDCRFHANQGCGVRLCGDAGDAALRSTFTQCEFRWNGIGLHATNARVACTVARCRFVDNLGAALFLANFMAAPTSAAVSDCLIAGNGGTGIYAMADGERLAVAIAHCTIAANGSAGIERKTRHSGSSTLAIRNCIVAGNAKDLEKIAADEVAASLVGDGSAGTGSDNLAGDPGFVDPRGHDWRLRPDSACVDRGEVLSTDAAIDLAGTARTGRPDLGAFELAPLVTGSRGR